MRRDAPDATIERTHKSFGVDVGPIQSQWARGFGWANVAEHHPSNLACTRGKWDILSCFMTFEMKVMLREEMKALSKPRFVEPFNGGRLTGKSRTPPRRWIAIGKCHSNRNIVSLDCTHSGQPTYVV